MMCSIEPIFIDNVRVCALHMTMANSRILLCNMYLPCDTIYNQDNVHEYCEVFQSVLQHSVVADVDCIIIGGDLNTDLTRSNSAHTTNLLAICDDENLSCVKWHPRCHVDYTYESLSNGQRSCLDHFIISEALYDHVIQCNVLHDGDNLSDHDVLSLHVDLTIDHNATDIEY